MSITAALTVRGSDRRSVDPPDYIGGAAGPTPQPSPRHHPWLPHLPAMEAGEPLRPAQTTDILPAGLVVTEAFVHSLKRARVVKSSEGVSSGVHPTRVPDP